MDPSKKNLVGFGMGVLLLIGVFLLLSSLSNKDEYGNTIEYQSCMGKSTSVSLYQLDQIGATFSLEECTEKFIRYPNPGKYVGVLEVQQEWGMFKDGESAHISIFYRSAALNQHTYFDFQTNGGENLNLREDVRQAICPSLVGQTFPTSMCGVTVPPHHIYIQSNTGPGGGIDGIQFE